MANVFAIATHAYTRIAPSIVKHIMRLCEHVHQPKVHDGDQGSQIFSKLFMKVTISV